MAIGIVAMCFASAFYYTSDLGVSTYDAIPLFLAKKGIENSVTSESYQI